jgi:hypothetical protein
VFSGLSHKEFDMRRPSIILLLALLAAVCLWWTGPLPQPAAAADKKPDPAPAPKRGEYELRLIRVGNTFQGMRFKVGTGESWILAGEKYEKVPDAAALPAGEYDITLITDDTNWMAFRIDRLTGTTWQLKDRKWVKMTEPADKKDE